MKYKLTEEIKEIYEIKFKRIKAIVDFGNVKKGDKGGWIEKEENLSGNAWVYGDARVYGDAQVSGNAWVYGDAQVCGNARVSGNAWVYGEIKCETGYYFARKEKLWEVKEIKVDKDNFVLWRE